MSCPIEDSISLAQLKKKKKKTKNRERQWMFPKPEIKWIIYR
jgi:hypothetical protein